MNSVSHGYSEQPPPGYTEYPRINFSSRGFLRFCQRGIHTIVLSPTLSGKLGWPNN
jgi:hypothetical protein